MKFEKKKNEKEFLFNLEIGHKGSSIIEKILLYSFYIIVLVFILIKIFRR